MGNNINTPYDDVFRTLLNDCPDLIIPVINEAFGTTFVMGRDIPQKLSNEFFFTRQDADQDEVISDSHIIIGGKSFHIECQSTSDGSMVVRMFEYDVQIAMQHAEQDLGRYTVEFPQSAVLYLRSTSQTPDFVEIRIIVPGDSCSYQIPTVKVKDFSVDDIYRKQLYFLIPFYSFVFEKKFKFCERDKNELEKLSEIFFNIRKKLKAVCENGIISEYYFQTLSDMSRKVIQNLASKFKRTSERIGDIMGGQILEYEAKTILNEGMKKGMQKGRQEGQIIVFKNMIRRGFSVKDAMSIAEITEEQANQALKELDKKE